MSNDVEINEDDYKKCVDWFNERKEPFYPSDMAEALDVDFCDVMLIIKRMEKEGIIEEEIELVEMLCDFCSKKFMGDPNDMVSVALERICCPECKEQLMTLKF